MNDERIEARLRGWLATEADSVTMPETVREAAADARARRAPRGRSVVWALSVPRPLLAGVAGLLVVLAGASLVLSGLLPIGRADCSRVSVDTVRAAADAVPGYTYRMNGSELMSELHVNEGVISFEYSTATVEFLGAYRAPDAWRLEYIVERGDSFPPVTIGGFLVREEWDAYVVIGDIVWARPRGADAFARMPVVGDIEMTMLGANRLTDLLAGEAFRWAISGDPPTPPLQWVVEPDGEACRLTATNELYADLTEVTWELELAVDPETSLPRTASTRFAVPEAPLPEDEREGVTNAMDTRMEFTFDYSNVPNITPPTDPQILPVTEERARDDAANAGGGLVMDLMQSALGATEVFVARGTDTTVLLVYEEGVLETELIIDRTDDVVVEPVLGTGGRFLAVVMHDLRVDRVEVDYSVARTEEFFAGSSRLGLVPFPEQKGDVVTWRAYDVDGNELVLNPRPPDT